MVDRPKKLTLGVLHPELRRGYRFMPNVPVRHRWQRALVRGLLRLAPAPKLSSDVAYERIDLAGDVVVHLFTPLGENSGSALFWIHGGGMVIGSAAQDHSRMVKLVSDLKLTVASVDYRLAPEHPFPAPMDDCHRAWEWLLADAAEQGINPDRIAIGGQSAGAGIAAGLVQRLADEGGRQPAAQWLFCPMLDDRTAANRDLDPLKHKVWNNAANRVGWRAYLDQEPGGDDIPPYASPARRSDLTGLPPAWIGTGTAELFYAEDRAYARALDQAGVDCTLDSVEGAPHAFESASRTPLAQSYIHRSRVWLRAKLDLLPHDRL
jgi:acetyl esterase/lipase